VGLMGSVNELVALSQNIVSSMYQFFEAVKEAPIRSRELREEMGSICGLLESLEGLVASNSQSTLLRSLDTTISELHRMLRDMNTRVSESQTRGLRRLKWPFTKTENERLLSRIGRYKETLNVTLNTQCA